MTALQLTIDGREVELAAVPVSLRAQPLSPCQEDILREARRRGGLITSTQAGVIAHRHRGSCGVAGGRTDRWTKHGTYGAQSCCQYAATDGRAAIKRLEARGLLEPVSFGLYAVPGT